MPQSEDCTITGWLFFDPDRTNLSFVPDDGCPAAGLDWKILLDDRLLRSFLAEFSPRQSRTFDTRLEGFYVAATLTSLQAWLAKHESDL